MPKKLKTRKAVSSRLKVKKSKTGAKILKRTDGQDHFNAREGGKTKRNKRSDKTMAKSHKKTILRAMPYA